MVLLLNIEKFSGIITSPSTWGLFCEGSQMLWEDVPEQ
jgi:hypothetical protein